MSAIGRSAHTTRWIPVGQISVVWAQSQRPFNKTWANKIKENFDPDMMGVLAVTSADKNGTYHAIDGQHRAFAIKDLWGEDQKVPCHVFDATSPARAAEIFDSMNTARRAPNPLEVFKVRVTAKTEPEYSVNKVITSLGWKVQSGVMERYLASVRACVHVYNTYGEDGLLNTLLRIRQTWKFEPTAVHGCIVKGMADFLNEYRGDVDVNRLSTKLAQNYTPARLLGAAKGMQEMFRGTLPSNVSRVMLNTYNHGLRKGRLGE